MELKFKSFGQGDPVIILHGLFGTMDNWQTLAKKLAEDFTVYIVDQRNHGRSPHDDLMDYSIMAEDLHHFMESHWIYKSHIIGHSMGGKTAMQFALNYPDMIDRLIVVDIGTSANKAGHQGIFDALFALNLDQIANRKEADNILAKYIEEFGIRQFLLKNLSRNKAGAYHWKMNLDSIHSNYPNILAAVEGEDTFDEPALFIKGGQSNYIDELVFSRTKALFTNARLETIEKAGHWVHAEAPEAILSSIKNFLSGSNS